VSFRARCLFNREHTAPSPTIAIAYVVMRLDARYSSDQQRPRSIADQQRTCHELFAREGWTGVADYSDAAVSGATLMRPGNQLLMRDREHKFDVVVAEALDRFSRDQPHIAQLFKLLNSRG
jgi:site-specific DNA recombinase